MQPRGAARVDERVEMAGPAGARAFLLGDDTHGVHRIVQLVGVRDFRPCLLAHRCDRGRIELAHVGGGFRIEPAALRDRDSCGALRAARRRG